MERSDGCRAVRGDESMFNLLGNAPFRRHSHWRSEAKKVLPLLVGISLGFFFLSAFAQNQAFLIRIIVVESADEAQQILVDLKNGGDFAKLAREKSIDPTASEGGFMGKMDTASLLPELQAALRNLHSGEFSAITKIQSGYAILQIMNTQPVEDKSPVQSWVMPTSLAASVRLVPNVSGVNEKLAVMGAIAKPPNWNQDLKKICELRTQADADALQRITDAVAQVNQGALQLKPDVEEDLHYTLAEVWSYHGEMDKAVAEWKRAYQIASTSNPGLLPQIQEALGVAYLHKSEMDNDVGRHPKDRCIFPIREPYPDKASSQKAIEQFLDFLKNDPTNLEVEWLLNLAFMTVGKYPQGVPKPYLISPEFFQSKGNLGRFKDVAAEAGLDVFSEAGGLIVDDFDNDGLLDIVTSSWNDCGPMHFFHNNGDGTFSDRTAQAGLADQLGGLNIIQTDYNNDGCLDILVLRGAWELPKRKSLLRNNCDGTFTDVTREAGLAEPATSTQTAVWTDINNDGYLDLFVGNENAPAQLFLNKGDGTFVDIAHSAGVDRTAFTKAVVAGDYDNDGYPDLLVSSYGEAFLYHNNHDLTFTEVSHQAGVKQALMSFPAWFFDYDNDGWPDLFLTSYYPSVEEEVAGLLHLPQKVEPLKLYKNMGDGTFKEVTKEVGLDRAFMPMGSNFGDIDNDGFLDFYLGTGNPSFATNFPAPLFHNEAGKYFVDVGISTGTSELHRGHGVAFADIDNDGDEDLIEVMGGAVPGDRHALRLFENPGNGNDWISIRLVGVKTNRPAIGARIKVTVENEGHGRRDIYRTVGSGGSFGASPFQQHIGLGKSARIENIEIWWPTSNTRQNFSSVEKDQFIQIKEFAKDYTKLVRPRFKLGGVQPTASATAGPVPAKLHQ